MQLKVRALTVCINCCKPKDVGLMLCWPCHREQKRKFESGYDPTLLVAFDLIEDGKVNVDSGGRFTIAKPDNVELQNH